MVKGKKRHIVYMGIALIMLVVMIPRLHFEAAWTAQSVFAVVWCSFALLVVAANLHALLGVDEATQKQLIKIKLAKRRMWQQQLLKAGNRSRGQ